MESATAGATRKRWLSVCVGVLFAFCCVYAAVDFATKPRAPSVPPILKCKALQPGIRRMANQRGFAFDAALSDFRIIEGTQDASPFAHGFDLTPTSSRSRLHISFGSHFELTPMDADPNLKFSEHSDKRRILDAEGRLIGEDYWGYLERGNIWRRVHLYGFVYATYTNANEEDAEHLNRVINSACLLSVDAEPHQLVTNRNITH